MSSLNALGVAVVAGIGSGTGTGGATARLFAEKGYRVALVSRGAPALEKLAESIKSAGGEAVAFPVETYDHASLQAAFKAIEAHWPSTPHSGVRFALFNVAQWSYGGFLSITEEQLQTSCQINIVAAFAFAQEAVKAILASTGEEEAAHGHRGTIVFTGATAAMRGSANFGAFALGKFGVRAISQSLAREYGKEGIHVAHAIIDGGIVTDLSKSRLQDEEGQKRLADGRKMLSPDSIAKSYWYLHNQDPSAWTQELDLRPAHEKW